MKNINTIEKTVPFDFDGETYDLKVTYMTEAKIYQRFGGGVSEALKGPSALVNIVPLITWLINDAIEEKNDIDGINRPLFTEGYVGRHLDKNDPVKIFNAVAEAFALSRPEVEEKELTDEEEKN